MKITAKTGYYALVIVMGILSLVFAFLILNFHNKYPNKITYGTYIPFEKM